MKTSDLGRTELITLGGYAFWTKRRFQPASNRFAAITLLAEVQEPQLYVIPSTEWLNGPAAQGSSEEGKASEPEYGISLARSSLDKLERYAWDTEADDYFR